MTGWPSSTHVAVLEDIFKSKTDVFSAGSSTDLQYFSSVVYCEVQHAVMGLWKTSLDLCCRGWVKRQFVTLWKQVSPNVLFSRAQTQRNLDPWLQGSSHPGILYLIVQEVLNVIALKRSRSQKPPEYLLDVALSHFKDNTHRGKTYQSVRASRHRGYSPLYRWFGHDVLGDEETGNGRCQPVCGLLASGDRWD
ncbi:hypothetical protein CLCR_05190 [Cladophialophora carrionii]|uniref:Uncharacterized protein n=1 Tax=Cladophialophora carrionii TaxID=86049 RepID=A0A1C1CLG1_9EURO|nr:hypothetical protein CLCR_05190 [Cladophialophora carrionii]